VRAPHFLRAVETKHISAALTDALDDIKVRSAMMFLISTARWT
jgi:hypothetical protein